ncbi:MAG: glycosyltransferase family 4 protein [Acidimicrobiia bacterium]|nr:glycosyltransferase family 4 protein [Acidimicrobiia bacterium]
MSGRAAEDPDLRVAVTLEQCWHRVPGGTARATLAAVNGLSALPSVEVIGVAAAHRQPPPAPWRPMVRVEHSLLPRPVLYEAWHRLRGPRLERITGPVDVVWASAMAMPPTAAAPVVASVHDLAFLDDSSVATRRGLRFFRQSVELVRRHAAAVVCPSDATAADCVRHGIDPERVRVVPWGLDLPAATAAEVDGARARFGLHGPFVLWVGTVEPRKNLPGLLEAWRRLGTPTERPPLVLVGPVGWGPALDEAVGSDRRGLVVTGFVDPSTLRGLYAAATVFCYPSSAEGFGLPVLEAMAQGTPVVTSAGTATEEVLGPDGGAGFAVPPSDHPAITAALARLLDDPALAERCGRAGGLRSEHYSEDRTARALATVFTDVVSRSSIDGRPGVARPGADQS